MKERITELLKKYEKHSKISKVHSEELYKMCNSELKETGLTEENVFILTIGPSDITMKSLVTYASNEDNGIKLIEEFLVSNQFLTSKKKYRLVSYIWTTLLSFSQANTPLGLSVLKSLVNLSINKKGSVNKALVATLAKEFNLEFYTIFMLPSLGMIKKNGIDIDKLIQLYDGVIASYKQKKSDVEIRKIIDSWLKEDNQFNVLREDVPANDIELKERKKNQTYYKNRDINDAVSLSPSNNIYIENRSKIEQKEELIKKNAREFDRILVKKKFENSKQNTWKTSLTQIEETINLLNLEINKKQRVISTNEKELFILNKRYEEKVVQVKNLESYKLRITQVIKEKEFEIDQLKVRLKDVDQINTIRTMNNSQIVSEKRNKLKSKLKFELQDFNDIEDEEMTVDLGENLRHQIRLIFDLLGTNEIL